LRGAGVLAKQPAMKILFVTGAPALPQMIAGSQRSSDAIIRGLIERGHDVHLLSALVGGGAIGLRAKILMRLRRTRAVRDRVLGYPTWRAWYPWDAIEEVVARGQYEAAVVLGHSAIRMAKAVQATGPRFLMGFQDVELGSSGSGLAELGQVHGVANSDFTRGFFQARFGLDPIVVHPIIEAAKYRTEPSGRYVTFVNPDAKKGLDVAIGAAAACPDLPFLFVEGWPLTPAQRTTLTARLAAVPNVTLHPSAPDMRAIYRQSRIMLVPSQWEEAFGRVAAEAQFSGIPVIGSDRGGLPEAIGDGGEVIDWQAPASVWAESLRRIWNDPLAYERLSAAALRHAARPALDPVRQLDAWERAIRTVAEVGDWGALPRSLV
jgi:glycosyltransferase involved in cell wall biosynthesis